MPVWACLTARLYATQDSMIENNTVHCNISNLSSCSSSLECLFVPSHTDSLPEVQPGHCLGGWQVISGPCVSKGWSFYSVCSLLLAVPQQSPSALWRLEFVDLLLSPLGNEELRKNTQMGNSRCPHILQRTSISNISTRKTLSGSTAILPRRYPNLLPTQVSSIKAAHKTPEWNQPHEF